MNTTDSADHTLPNAHRHVLWIGQKRKRPRLCAVCHEDATYVEMGLYATTVIGKDGGVRHEQVPKGTYYCDLHTGPSFSRLAP